MAYMNDNKGYKFCLVLIIAFFLGACNDGAGKDLPTTTSNFEASNYGLSISTDKTIVTADGTDKATITVYVYDADRGLSVGAGTRITFSADLGGVDLTPTSFTEENGVAEAVILNSAAGVATVTATAPDGTTTSLQITFV